MNIRDPYGLFEIQYYANTGKRKSIVYSKRVSKILPNVKKIVETIGTSFEEIIQI
jgi:hypothetical protein